MVSLKLLEILMEGGYSEGLGTWFLANFKEQKNTQRRSVSINLLSQIIIGSTISKYS